MGQTVKYLNEKIITPLFTPFFFSLTEDWYNHETQVEEKLSEFLYLIFILCVCVCVYTYIFLFYWHFTNYTTEPLIISTIFPTLSHYEHPQVLPVNVSNIFSIVNNYKHYFFR